MKTSLAFALLTTLSFACDDDGPSPSDGGSLVLDAAADAPVSADGAAVTADGSVDGPRDGVCTTLAACCTRIADLNLAAACGQTANLGDDGVCAIALPLYTPACP